MSEENVEIVRRGYDAFTTGDITAMLENVDSEIVSYTAPPLLANEYRGRDGLLEWIGDWTEEFGEFEMDILSVDDVGPQHVIARARQRARGAGSGVPVERDFWFLHRLDRGKIVRMGVHASEADALEAAGESE